MTAAASPDMLQGFRPLAVARNFDDIRKIFRARCDELNVGRATIDKVGGLADGATSKLLAPVRDQEMGRISFPAMLGALGLAVVVVEDTEAIGKLRHRLAPRSAAHVNDADAKKLTRRRRRIANAWKGNSAWGRVMAARRQLVQSQYKRKQIARNAARARWEKRRPKRRPAAEASP